MEVGEGRLQNNGGGVFEKWEVARRHIQNNGRGEGRIQNNGGGVFRAVGGGKEAYSEQWRRHVPKSGRGTEADSVHWNRLGSYSGTRR